MFILRLHGNTQKKQVAPRETFDLLKDLKASFLALKKGQSAVRVDFGFAAPPGLFDLVSTLPASGTSSHYDEFRSSLQLTVYAPCSA